MFPLDFTTACLTVLVASCSYFARVVVYFRTFGSGLKTVNSPNLDTGTFLLCFADIRILRWCKFIIAHCVSDCNSDEFVVVS